jgi:hypothetical protein
MEFDFPYQSREALFISSFDEVVGVVEQVLVGMVSEVEWVYGIVAECVYAKGVVREDSNLW